MKINITSGECLNAILKDRYPDEDFIPFNEAMIKGSYSCPLFSEGFISERAAVHGVEKEEYRRKLEGFLSFLEKAGEYDEAVLWFGDEPFCVKNTDAVINALMLYGYRGKMILNTVNEESGDIVSSRPLCGREGSLAYKNEIRQWYVPAEKKNTDGGKKEISLRPVTEENFLDAFMLRLAEGQERYVSAPVRSLAQAYIYRDRCAPFGVYSGDDMVGYLMVIYDYGAAEYGIWHFMIDREEQGRGYGRAAMLKALEYIGTKPFGSSGRVVLTCNRENESALGLYRSLGFEYTGNEFDCEYEMALDL